MPTVHETAWTGGFPGALLGPMRTAKAAVSTNSRTWWRHPRCKGGLPSSCSRMSHNPYSRPVFELVVSKHMVQTKLSSPHSWMALCTAWAIAWPVPAVFGMSNNFFSPIVETRIGSLSIFSFPYPSSSLTSIYHPSVQPMWLERFKNHTQLKMLWKLLHCRSIW